MTFSFPTRALPIRALAALAAVLCVSCGDKADSPIPEFVTLDYYASPYDGRGSQNLLIREGAQLELYGIADTLRGELTEAELRTIASAMQSVARWDTSYESSMSDRYETVRKIDPQGIATIRRTGGSEAPAAVDSLLNALAGVVQRLRSGDKAQ